VSTKQPVIAWSCQQRPGFYLLSCRLGDLELFEIIERQHWVRAIDRVLIFKRAISTMQRAMHNIICAGIE
jgi:hypothetical protein